jgi:uncharacterized protein YjiS (DUF1127 family)
MRCNAGNSPGEKLERPLTRSRDEMIMSTISNATLQTDVFPATLPRRLAGILRRWWIAYTKWRLDELAIGQLRAMSDRELKDMGVSRATIDFAVKRHAPHSRSRRYY